MTGKSQSKIEGEAGKKLLSLLMECKEKKRSPDVFLAPKHTRRMSQSDTIYTCLHIHIY